MELYDENVNEKKSKVPMIIGISIGILSLITILVVVGIIYLKNSIVVAQINGIRNNEIEQILYVKKTEEGHQLYIPIIKMAKHLGYQGFIGDYKYKSEDNTKCHVKDLNGNETAMFVKDSNVLIKISRDGEVEYITIDKPVFEKDGQLYTTISGIENAFNVKFYSDEKFKNINIYTMDYLIAHYATQLNITNYSTNFTDKKSILQNMMIVISDSRQYGVISAATKKLILEAKYEEIRYLPTTNDFIVKSNGKYGIVTKEATIKVRMVYDEIKIMDNQIGLYLVKQNNAYGVINNNGDVVLQPEYKQIGINIRQYAQNGVESPYVLLNEIIPIMNQQGLWAFFNIKGEQITDFIYTGLGCIVSSASNSYGALVIPSSKVIVVQKDKFYTLVTIEGKQLIPDNTLNSVYLKSNTETGENQFFMTYSNNEKIINVEEWLTNSQG